MRLPNDGEIHNILLYISILFLIFGFISLIYFRFDFVLGSISIVIACVSLRVSIRSQWISHTSSGIAGQSLDLSLTSDRRVREISNSLFLGVVSSFEDRRLSIQLTPRMIHIQLWKALVDLEKADAMKEYSGIDKKHFDTLGKRYIQLLELTKRSRFRKMLFCEDIKHLLKMYNLLRHFKIDRELRREMYRRLKVLLGIQRGGLTIARIDRILGNITERNRWHLYLDKINEVLTD